MKSIITSILLLFSLNSYTVLAANQYIQTNGYGYEAHPLAPGAFSCFNDSCSMGSGVYTYLTYGFDLVSNNDYLYIPTGDIDFDGLTIYTTVYRNMVGGGPFKVMQDASFMVTWSTVDSYNSTIWFNEEAIDINGNTSGSFIVNYLAGDIFTAAIIGKANSADAYVQMNITPIIEVSEVPLPPAFLMLAPALIGFLGFRLKRS